MIRKGEKSAGPTPPLQRNISPKKDVLPKKQRTKEQKASLKKQQQQKQQKPQEKQQQEEQQKPTPAEQVHVAEQALVIRSRI